MSIELKGRRPCPTIRLYRLPRKRYPDGLTVPAQTVVEGVHRIVHHSPTGLEWGYGGSGPADLALSIMAFCLPVGCDGEDPELLFKATCSPLAYQLHQRFKWEVIAAIPEEGATILGSDVDRWIDGALAKLDQAGEEKPRHGDT